MRKLKKREIKKQTSAYPDSKKSQHETRGCVAEEFIMTHLAILLHDYLGLRGAIKHKTEGLKGLQLLTHKKPFTPLGEHMSPKNPCFHIHHQASW